MDWSALYGVLMVGATAAFVVAAVLAWLPLGRRVRTRQLDRLAAAVGLGVAPEVVGMLERRSDRGRRFRAIGGLVAWSGAGAGCLLQSGWVVTPATFWCSCVACFGGAALGSGAAAVIDARTRGAVVDTRVARLRVVGTEDYLPARQIRLVMVAAALAVTGVSAAIFVMGPAVGLVGLLMLVVAAVLLVTVGPHVIVKQPQPASSATELEWDDAIRSQNLGIVTFGGVTVCFYATLGAVATVTASSANSSSPRPVVALIVTTIATAAATVVMLISSASSNPRYYRDRLWPGRDCSTHDLPNDHLQPAAPTPADL